MGKPRRNGGRVVQRALPLLLTTAGVLALGLYPLVPDWEWLVVVLAIVFTLASGVFQFFAPTISEKRDADLLITFKDALIPLVKQLSTMVDMKDPDERIQFLRTVSEKAASALAYALMPHVKSPRANIYFLDEDDRSLRVLAFTGRSDAPGEFVPPGEGEHAAVEGVKRGEPLTVHDLAKDPPPGWKEHETDWQSFVSFPIVSGDGYAYGMVTVDSTQKNSFWAPEENMVNIIASLLAVAFALAYPSPTRPGVGGDGRIKT